MSTESTRLISSVHESVRRHQSVGRAFLYSIVGELDVEVRADGPWVFGASGRRYLDWGGYSVFLLGHAHPNIVSAIAHQLSLLPGSTRAFPNEPIAAFHREMIQMVPAGISKFMLLNSGTEAVEAAMKLARVTTGRDLILHLEKSFHGKTLGALSVTDADIFRAPFRTLDQATARISRSDASAAADAIKRLRPAAVIVEAIQGEGGIYALEPNFLETVAAACAVSGGLLICDEIQCGLGRSGALWAFAPAHITPDIILMGKALGGGIMPVSAVAATPAAFAPFDRDPLLHTSTFGGNPLAAAAAAAALELIRHEDIARTCACVGAAIDPWLHGLIERFPAIFCASSGCGLLRGLHFTRPDRAAIFLQKCFSRGLLLTPCLTTPHVLRLSPPAITGPSELELAFNALEHAAQDTLRDLA